MQPPALLHANPPPPRGRSRAQGGDSTRCATGGSRNSKRPTAGSLELLIVHRRYALTVVGGALHCRLAAAPGITGTDFFPSTDAGMMKIHFRAPSGTRIEQTEHLVARAEELIRGIVPPAELQTINSTIGLPQPLNMAFVPTDNVSEMDAEILVALNPGHAPTAGYVDRIRNALQTDFRDRRPTSRQPTSSGRCSTSDCRHRSTCRSWTETPDRLRDGAARCAMRSARCPGQPTSPSSRLWIIRRCS